MSSCPTRCRSVIRARACCALAGAVAEVELLAGAGVDRWGLLGDVGGVPDVAAADRAVDPAEPLGAARPRECRLRAGEPPPSGRAEVHALSASASRQIAARARPDMALTVSALLLRILRGGPAERPADRLAPAGVKPLPLGGVELRLPLAADPPLGAQLVGRGPEADRESGRVRRAERRRLGDLR